MSKRVRDKGKDGQRGKTQRGLDKKKGGRGLSVTSRVYTLMKVLIMDVVESKLHSLVWNVDQSSSDTDVLVVIFDLEVSQ